MKASLIYGPAYRPDTAPFPEAVDVAPLPEYPRPRVTERQYRTSSGRRPRPSLWRRLTWKADHLRALQLLTPAPAAVGYRS